MKLVLIDSKEIQHPVSKKAIDSMIKILDENDLDQASLKLLLYIGAGDEENVQRLGKILRKVREN